MNIDGRCHCGYIRFEADADPDKAAICHCTDCQSFSGSNVPLAVIGHLLDHLDACDQDRHYLIAGSTMGCAKIHKLNIV